MSILEREQSMNVSIFLPKNMKRKTSLNVMQLFVQWHNISTFCTDNTQLPEKFQSFENQSVIFPNIDQNTLQQREEG